MEADTIYLQASTLVVEFELIALGPEGGSIMPRVFIAVDTAQRQLGRQLNSNFRSFLLRRPFAPCFRSFHEAFE